MPVTLHFLNVGHGDCTVIEHHSGRLTMIDINNSKSLPEGDIEALAANFNLSKAAFRSIGPAGFRSWEDYYRSLLVDPVDYFLEHFRGRSIFRYLQTHPDMDHLSGLYRLFWQEKIALENLWDTAHTRTRDKGDFEGTRFDWLDWAAYLDLRSGYRADGQQHKVLHLTAGSTGEYWVDDCIEILSPTVDLIDYANSTENWNNSSYVIRVSHAGRSVILAGDAEEPAWDKIEAIHHESVLDCDVLKAAHHGRNSGYSESAVAAMDPEYVICSIGKKPETDASAKYSKQGAQVLSTRAKGTIRVTIYDNGHVQISDDDGDVLGEIAA